MSKIVRLVLGDQLNPRHSWFTEINPNVTYAFIECRGEGSYAPHHIQKVVGIFQSMRTFASRLESEGHRVFYHKILDSREIELIDILHSASVKMGVHELQFMVPDEWRVKKNLESLESRGFKISFTSSEHFISSPGEFKKTFEGKKATSWRVFTES